MKSAPLRLIIKAFGRYAARAPLFSTAQPRATGALVASLLFASFSLAQAGESVTLTWAPSADADIAGYRLHYGTVSGNYSQTIDVRSVTTFTVPDLTLGTSCFAAVTAYNAAGLESSFSNEVSFTVSPWLDAVDLGDGWKSSTWFGDFNVNAYPWIYHQQHGWMYVYGTDPTSIWFFTQDMGFLWTSSTKYPFLWSDPAQAWLWYSKGTSAPRWFFNYKSGQWVQRNP